MPKKKKGICSYCLISRPSCFHGNGWTPCAGNAVPIPLQKVEGLGIKGYSHYLPTKGSIIIKTRLAQLLLIKGRILDIFQHRKSQYIILSSFILTLHIGGANSNSDAKCSWLCKDFFVLHDQTDQVATLVTFKCCVRDALPANHQFSCIYTKIYGATKWNSSMISTS